MCYEMKKISYLPILAALLVLQACNQTTTKQGSKPRIAIAGLAIESSTFSPATTDTAAFHPKRGEEIFTNYPFFAQGSELREAAEWVPTLTGKSIPGGAVTREAYEALVGELLDSLANNLPYDGLFFDIHGAMSVVGLDDAEGDLITRVREVVGNKTVISTSMDLHGCVTEPLAGYSDLITCYRLAPHEDAMESKERAVRNLVDRLVAGTGKPAYKALIPVPILLAGEQTSTRIEPGKSLYAAVEPTAAQKGIVDAGIWMGYPWADEPRNHANVMVVGDDKAAVKAAAEALARKFWDVRREFDFVAPTTTLDSALAKALISAKKPFIISDMGDNPTAGGAGDVTKTLTDVLAKPAFASPNGPMFIYASLPGPDLVEKALKAGIGNPVEGFAGALVDSRFAPPLKLSGTVHAIREGDRDAEVEVVVKTNNNYIIVTKKRKPYHNEKDFTDLKLSPREADILMVKIGYLVPELYDIRGDWVMALTVGGVDPNLSTLPYKRIQRPMFPLDKDMEDPDLSARFIPLSHEYWPKR
ncbi:microcystin degradation protein MlrC [Parapedobacter pyrenivorans]|uniref:Microcystin degradation protein MlrC n=2 Tax=Parapedobacter pyrenivorans TaxID=1305674 RepID=A0A917MF71_9SPHI|nr:microcystin degradation protein MlrC [Parapedobacter pyrenivorans]